jgi:ParE-like toxin of type II ParDE toxin-antitoxin system
VRIVVSPPTLEDLKQAYQQITQDNPKAADRMLTRIIEVIGMLASGSV